MWGRYASRRGEARYPTLWDGRVVGYCPSVTGPTGTRLYNLQESRYQATLTNLTAANGWQRSGGQYAIRTSGTDQSLEILNQSHVLVSRELSSANMTFSCWLNPVSLNKRGICTSGPVLTGPQFALTVLTNGKIETYRGGNVTSTGAISTAIWSHLAVVCLNNVTTFYLNGVLDSSFGQGTTALAQSTFLFGGNYWGPFEGFTDDYAIWRRALTAGEIRTLSRRRGIAYEARRQDFGEAGFKPYWSRQRTQLIGGGLR
jgi:hypothetical protein